MIIYISVVEPQDLKLSYCWASQNSWLKAIKFPNNDVSNDFSQIL